MRSLQTVIDGKYVAMSIYQIMSGATSRKNYYCYTSIKDDTSY